MKLFRNFYILFFLFNTILFGQSISQLAVTEGSVTKYIPVYQRQGTVYFSIRHFADALSIDYDINSETDKIRLKIADNTFIVTANNPFFVLNIGNGKEVYQLPTSAYKREGIIFIPLKYSLKVLNKIFNNDLELVGEDHLILKKSSLSDIIAVESMNENTGKVNNFNISGLDIDEKANGTLVRIKTDKRIRLYNSAFKNNILKIIFRNVSINENAFDRSNGEGLIKDIKARNIHSDSEIQFKLTGQFTSYEVLNVENSNDILITLHNKIFANHTEIEKIKDKWNFDVVVIDAGHGGKDAGAIGINGVKEKNVNLGIALKLGNLIQKNLKDVKVVYTRSNDTFVELYKRGKIANEKNGKLFISIHCNSTRKKPTDANGFEVYLLRPGRTKEAIAIAERENSVIEYEDNPRRYQQLTDENFILVSMAHSAFMKYSEKFSDFLNKQFKQNKSINSRGIKQAGFYVLVGAAMPSVLVESGFLSNRHDADLLKSSSGQAKIAQSIFTAVKEFKDEYEKSIDSE